MENETARRKIEARAYQLYLDRGCEPGGDCADWLQAERELEAAGYETANVGTPTPAKLQDTELSGRSEEVDAPPPPSSKKSSDRSERNGHASNGAVNAQGRGRRSRAF